MKNFPWTAQRLKTRTVNMLNEHDDPTSEDPDDQAGAPPQAEQSARGIGITSPESIELIVRAKEGDREAWKAICERYYPLWMRKFHGKLGDDLRNVQETQDLVQSAIAEAIADVGKLRNDAAFFSWVCTIIRHKLYAKRRKKGPADVVPLDEVAEPGKQDSCLEGDLSVEEDYFQLLDSVQTLFKTHPDEMTAMYLRYFEHFSIQELVDSLEISERSIHRLLSAAKELLKARLDRDSA